MGKQEVRWRATGWGPGWRGGGVEGWRGEGRGRHCGLPHARNDGVGRLGDDDDGAQH